MPFGSAADNCLFGEMRLADGLFCFAAGNRHSSPMIRLVKKEYFAPMMVIVIFANLFIPRMEIVNFEHHFPAAGNRHFARLQM